MKKWEKFSREEIEKIVADSRNYGDLSKRLGYTGNTRYDVVKDMVDTLGLDVSHFRKGSKAIDYSKFTYGKRLNGPDMLPAIATLRGRMCEICGLDTWLDNPITLEVHHKDGDKLNNNLDNLQLLCPNCHSMTSNWKSRGKKYDTDKDYVKDEVIINAIEGCNNIREILLKARLSDNGSQYRRIKKLAEKNGIELPYVKKEPKYCVDCSKEIHRQYTRCQKCENLLRKQKGLESLPVTRNELKKLIRTNTFTQIGRQFNVADNTIRKWCVKFGLPKRTRDIVRYSDEEWDII